MRVKITPPHKYIDTQDIVRRTSGKGGCACALTAPTGAASRYGGRAGCWAFLYP